MVRADWWCGVLLDLCGDGGGADEEAALDGVGAEGLVQQAG
ncbi:hypothetical protein QF011_003664, partial [Curtobacterium flaccumfaciens]|nr:hypothetical protein [Curtobacterium flaccumfaciens]